MPERPCLPEKLYASCILANDSGEGSANNTDYLTLKSCLMKNSHHKPAFFVTAFMFGALSLAHAGSFSTDFNSGAPAAMTLYGTASVPSSGGYTNSGYLQLTTVGPGGNAAVLLNDLDSGTPVVSFTAQFKILLGNNTGYPADGMSFNFAPDLPAGTYPQTPYGSTTLGAEEGAGTGYTIEFDTYLNGAPDTAPSIDVKVGGGLGDHSTYDGNEFAQAIDGGLVPSPEAFVDCVVQLNPDNTLTVVYDGVYVYSNLDLSASGYNPVGGSQFGIGARSGGLRCGCRRRLHPRQGEGDDCVVRASGN